MGREAERIHRISQFQVNRAEELRTRARSRTP